MIVLTILLLMFSIYIIYFNWKSFYVQTILDEPYSSVVPFVGGVSLFFASFIILDGSLKYFSLLSFLIDYGSLTFILHSMCSIKYSEKYESFANFISNRRRNKKLIFEKLSNMDQINVENLFYKIFNENEGGYMSYEKNNSNYFDKNLPSEINKLFSKFKKIKVGNYYLSIDDVQEITCANGVINKAKIGYFLMVGKKEKKYLILNEKNLILEGWNQNIFHELIATILLKKYKNLTNEIISKELAI